jgi:hypothetical protein
MLCAAAHGIFVAFAAYRSVAARGAAARLARMVSCRRASLGASRALWRAAQASRSASGVTAKKKNSIAAIMKNKEQHRKYRKEKSDNNISMMRWRARASA